MVVIIKKENGLPVYNVLEITEQDRIRSQKLDKALAKLGPIIEKEWLKQKKTKKGKLRINEKVVYRISERLAEIVNNENLVLPNERKWVWKALREMYLKSDTFTKRSKIRDDLEYIYKVSKYPFQFIKSITWDGWRRFLDYPSIREDERFEKWLQEKAKKSGEVKKGFMRKFAKILYSLIKNKDTTVFSERELFEIYESAWNSSLSEK
jgi:hypothetical protein